MHPSLVDLGKGHDGALQFALQCTPVVDVFGELGGAEVHFVEELEADPPCFRKTGRCHREAQIGQAR